MAQQHHKYDLLEQVVTAVTESGWNVSYLSRTEEHPFRLLIYREDENFKVRVYIWHMTHGGGRARPANEYRIQITGVTAIQAARGEKTLILGWWQEGEVFAGFDVQKHLGTLGRSPSIQIREEYLRQAYVNGFSPCDKGNGEIAIAFRPDFFVDYVRNLEQLHSFGQSPQDAVALGIVSQNPQVNDAELEVSSKVRRTTMASVRRALRDISFRRRVLTAYSRRCAMCGLQLRLVDAAHIIPVSHENSTDETRNGLALCALHHRAYDQALVTVMEDYSLELNDKQIREIRKVREAGGLEQFSESLRALVLLPPAVQDRPHVEYIKIANRSRGWNR